MKKLSRMTALMLALMLFITSLPITALAEITLDTSVWQGWVNSVKNAFQQAQTTTEAFSTTVDVPVTAQRVAKQYKTPAQYTTADSAITLLKGTTAKLTSVDGAGQWKFVIDEEHEADIPGETGDSIILSERLLVNGTATIRCGKGAAVKVTLSNGNALEDSAETIPVAVSGERQVRTGMKFTAGDVGISTLDETADVKKTYDIIINYVFENNEIVSDPYTANLAEGSSFSATVTFPTVQGYLPYVGETQQDSMVLNYPSVTEAVTINVVYKPTNVNYTVIHQKQNADNDGYAEKTETKQGLTGSKVPEVAHVYQDKDGNTVYNPNTDENKEEYKGFYSLVYEKPAIAADGSTVIEVYYDRYYYLMNFDMDGGYGTEPVYARFGAEIEKPVDPTKAGYTFGGWSETEGGTTAVPLPTTMPAANKTYYAIWKPDDTAKVTVVFWGENADDEGYSYLEQETKDFGTLNLVPSTEFKYTLETMIICGKEEHDHGTGCANNCGKEEHTHSAVGGSCYKLNCEHSSHSLTCYQASYGYSIVEMDSAPTGELTGLGNGIYTYTTSFGGQTITHYCLRLDDKWYCAERNDTIPISYNCSHKHSNSCYNFDCNETEHTHNNSCYSCGKVAHKHENDCYLQSAGLDGEKWKFVKSDDPIIVAADGSSVVNVYYDRVEYSVQFYNGSGNSEYTDIKITAKWGAYIGDKWPTRNNSGTWAVNPSSNNNVSGPYQVYLQEMPVGGDKFYGPRTDNGTQSAYYYVEILPGETGTETYNNKSYKLHHTDTSPGSDYVVTDDDKYAIQGFTFVGFTATRNNRGNYRYNGSKFYYTRNSYKLTFNDQFNDVKTETVKFEAPLSIYKSYEPEVPSAYEPGSVKFGGWYQNPQCSGEEYKLDEHKMPANDIILYAKWVPVTRTVKFYLTESSEAVYTPKDATEASFTVPHGSTLDEEYVEAHLTKDAMNEAKPNGDYTFVMWYYYENGEKMPFDPTTQIRKDLTLYGEWSSNTLKEYTVQYVLKDDHSVKVADDLTGSGLAGTTKTFDAKGDTELYVAYKEGYFPTVQSQSLLLDIDKETLTITFEYVQKDAVPYTVKYVEKDTGNSLWTDKVVSDNRKAVVTENFQPISGYMPDAYQKRLVVTADGENILYFYYTKDTEHAYYKITHYKQNLDGATWEVHAESQAIGDIGTRYTASPMTIPGYTYDHIEYKVNNEVVTDVTDEGAVLTADGLEINLYYVPNTYPYQVRYLEQGSGKELAKPKNGNGKYGEIISESAIDIDGYDKVEPTSATLNIRIDEGEGAPTLNIITFYYKEQEVTINYVAVGPEGATDFGSVDPESETVKVKSGTAQGSTPAAGDGFKFVGWFKDEACTETVDTAWVVDNKITPQKTETIGEGEKTEQVYEAATYYAKFEYDVTKLTITKSGLDQHTYAGDQDRESAIFEVKITDLNNGTKTYMIALSNAEPSATILDVQIGSTYTITELNAWTWRYENQSFKTGVVKPDNVAEGVKIDFANVHSNQKWLGGDNYKINELK